MEIPDTIKEESDIEFPKQTKRRGSFLDLIGKGEIYHEKEILEQFRKNLFDVLTPDVTDKRLLKFLRTRSFNLKRAEDVYRMMLRTRDIFKTYNLVDCWEPPENLRQCQFDDYIGIAKDGTPIRYMAMGQGDLKGFMMSLEVHDMVKYFMLKIEKDLRRCKEQSIKLGKEIDEVTYIVDMDSFAIGHIFFSGVTELGFDFLNILQDLYPEIWQNIFVVNAPFYFPTIFNIFKPIFRSTIMQKMHVVSRENTSALLLKYIDAEVLPAFLGGERVDSNGDPMCSEFIKFGGIVPEEYRLCNKTLLDPTDYGVEDVWLRQRCCHNICLVVRHADSIIRAEMRTEGGSIPAIVLYRKFGPDSENPDIPGKDEYLDPNDEKDNVVQCTPLVHLQTHYSPIDNYFFAPWPGIYIIRFINSYNWLTQRRCIYRYRVLPPDVY